MEANKLDAEKCLAKAVQFAYEGDYDKAVRFVEKSVKLYPTEQAQQMLSDYQTRLGADESKSQQQQQQQKEDSKARFDSKTSLNDDEEECGIKNDVETSDESNKSMSDHIRRISCCRCFYQILGVTRSASESDLRRAYKRLALQFHPDKNQLPGATDCFKAIGKAFAVLSDSKKRKDYDIYGPEMFEAPMSGGGATRHPAAAASATNLRRGSYNTAYGRKGAGPATTTTSNSHTTFYYWSEDDFSADELFNLFFGNYSNDNNGQTSGGGGQTLSGSSEGLNNNRRSQRGNRTTSRGGGNGSINPTSSNFVYSSSNNYAILFQFMPIVLIILLSLFSNLLVGEPAYSLQKTNKYIVKRTTSHYQIPYFVKASFSMETAESSEELDGMERQIEESVRQELKQACFREKHFKETAMWRAQRVDDERLMRKANDYETPACDKLRTVFGMAIS